MRYTIVVKRIEIAKDGTSHEIQHEARIQGFPEYVCRNESREEAISEVKKKFETSCSAAAANRKKLPLEDVTVIDTGSATRRFHGRFWDLRERLLERRELLKFAEEQEELEDAAAAALQQAALASAELGNDDLKDVTKNKAVAGAVRYRLAVANLFVEKAQYHLEERANYYLGFGIALSILAFLTCLFGICLAVTKTIGFSEDNSPGNWIDLTYRFTIAFTAYGLIVLLAVNFAKFAKACLDQRERLLTKRHSLRQGRLFLHLRAGLASIEDLQKAFDWNNPQTNAFTELNADAKAPWGNVLQEMVKIIPQLVTTGINAAERAQEKRDTAAKSKFDNSPPPPAG